ncbi:SRPBCC family protein [Chitinibacter sp. GC72]|uniref:SRPBCC family protein n=1 Tax=Chitinibacter sp. GC72 TaxID=1526917 RepID=UPI0012F70D5E|nr:SRPBCC family protein [Chitinibacter sp. GC72]
MRWFLILLLLYSGASHALDTPILPLVSVQASERDGHVLFNAQFLAPVTQAQAFAVLSDFDHMAEFMPNMSQSKVLSRQGNHWHIRQQGQLQLGPISMTLDSERDIEIQPMEQITARSINSSNGAFSSRMQLQAQGRYTQMNYQADWIPNSALMRTLGKQHLQTHIAQQFGAMQKEMLRRGKLALASAPQGF